MLATDLTPELFDAGRRAAAAAGAMMTYGDFSTLVDLPRFQKLDEDYG